MGASWSTAEAPSQAGRLAIVTGANSGIGFPTALEIAKAGADVIIACRDEARGREALAKLRSEYPRGNFDLKLVDLSSLSSVQRFADELLAAGRPVDLLVNNAGIMMLPTRQLSPDGYEMQIATNHIGSFALTGRLLPLILRSPSPRVVNVSSLMAHTGDFSKGIDFKFTDATYGRGIVAYGNTKLANQLFSEELARRYPRLTVAISHPGGTATNLQRHNSQFSAMKFMMQTPADGARPSIRAALGGDVKSVDYYGPLFGMFGRAAHAWKARQTSNPEIARKLWEESQRATGVTY